MSRFAATPRRLAAVLAASALTLSACGNGDDTTATPEEGTGETGVTTVTEGSLTMCTHLAYPPFEFADESGEIVGFDVEIAQLAAAQLGLSEQIEVVDVPFEQVVSGAAFQAGQCDVGIAGMTITPERANAIAFSEPYFDATQALITQQGSGIESLADLQGMTLGVQATTTGEIYAQEQAEANGYEIVVFEDLPTSANAVLSGRVDAAINDNGVLYDFARQNPTTEVVAEFDTGEQYGIGALLNDDNAQQILDAANEAIATAREDGTYDQMYQRWFGVLPQSAQQEGDATSAPTN